MGDRYEGSYGSYGYTPEKTYTWDEMCKLLKQDLEAREAYREDNEVRLEYLDAKGNWVFSKNSSFGGPLKGLFYRVIPKQPLKNLAWLNGMVIVPKNGGCYCHITDANEKCVVIDGKMKDARYLFEFYQFTSGKVIGE